MIGSKLNAIWATRTISPSLLVALLCAAVMAEALGLWSMSIASYNGRSSDDARATEQI
jgi:hypothetical protein